MALVGACAASPPSYEGDDPGECADDLDNDQDGKKNCADPGCAGSAACVTGTGTDTTLPTSVDANTSDPGPVPADAASGNDVASTATDKGIGGSDSADAVADAVPPADAAPPGDAVPPADVAPPGDAVPPADVAPAGDASPPADVAPPVDAAPPADAKQPPDAGPVADTAPDVAPPADVAPAPDVPPDTGPPLACTSPKMSDLYEKKIKPLVTKGQPSTCNQCHLSGVDLGMFVQDTPCKTMACMVDKGIVNLGDPKASKVLEWLAKGKPQSALITGDILGDEKAAFLEWIQHSSLCQTATCGKIANPCGDLGTPPPIVPNKPMLGGCGETDLAAAFQAQVYKWRDRCSHCHSPAGKDYIKSGAPGWLSADTTNAGSIFTMYNVIGLGLIHKTVPEQSLLLLKPLPKSLNGGVVHGGGVKFQNKADVSYVDFLKWIKTYQACVNKVP